MALTLRTITASFCYPGTTTPIQGRFIAYANTSNHTYMDTVAHPVFSGPKIVENDAATVSIVLPDTAQAAIAPANPTYIITFETTDTKAKKLGILPTSWLVPALTADTTLDTFNVVTSNTVPPTGLGLTDSALADILANPASATRVAMDARLNVAYATRLDVDLGAPTGIAATDTAAFAAALTAAGSSGRIVARRGTYSFNAISPVPDGVDLVGQGGGSTSVTGKTIFTAAATGTTLELAGFKSMTGRFQVSQGSATGAVFKRSGGTGANGGSFVNITVQGTGAGAGGATADLVLFYAAQNDLWLQCGFAEGNRDLAVYDQGYGGATFLRCEWAGAGRYHHRYDNAVSGGPYSTPSDNHHLAGIFERNSGTSIVYGSVGNNNTYSDHAFYSANGTSGPMVDLVNVSNWAFHDAWFQNTASTRVTGSEALHARNSSNVVLSGRTIFQNLDKPLVADGASAYIYKTGQDLAYNSGTTANPINGANYGQIGERVDWTNATVSGVTTNPSSAGGAPIGYAKGRSGFVHLRGRGDGVTINSTLFTLPAGFRPQYDCWFAVWSVTGAGAGTLASVRVTTAGAVSVPFGAGGAVAFDGITFQAYQ